MTEHCDAIIALAEPNDDGKLHYTAAGLAKLKKAFSEALTQPDFAPVVDGFVRAVAAFEQGGESHAAKQLMETGDEVLAAVQGQGDGTRKLQGELTGASDLKKLKPVGGEAPEGAVKATAFIRPLPRSR